MEKSNSPPYSILLLVLFFSSSSFLSLASSSSILNDSTISNHRSLPHHRKKGGHVQYVTHNVLHYGAKADGVSDSTPAFSQAWEEACKSSRPASVHVPKGTYMLKPIVFYGPCQSKMLFHVEGKVVGPKHYWEFGKSGFWILFYKLEKLTILGGTYDAQGSDYWACRSITIIQSRNVVVKGIKSLNPQMFHLAIDHCHQVLLKKLYIEAPTRSPNTDGIHIMSSEGITIAGAVIKTGDDCIAIGPGTKNVHIRGVHCGPGHGISIGSLGLHTHEAGVENVFVTDSVMTRTQNGLRIKSWGRKTTSFVRNVVFENIAMENSYNPIIIDQNYCPYNKNCPGSGVKISGVTYRNIHGTSASPIAVKFVCSASRPCTGLQLHNVRLTYHKAIASSVCTHAGGGVSGVVSPRSCFRK
ncbi:unnamed protein product [Linum tenue]|uniref:Polygalacturonase n=1 Tax=Linum tenue TaxID=586396 RepID=A0AAV0IKS1_9ROSI|nr:unnamed protein product [Linum tenue]